MIDFSKKSQAEKYFDSVIKDMKQTKIKAIFSMGPVFRDNRMGGRTYSCDSEIYVMFGNEYCLVIDYPFIDALDVQLRKLTSEEAEAYKNLCEKDFFNTVSDIYDFYTAKVCKTEECSMDYGSVTDISLRSVRRTYGKWIDDGITFVSPTDETFDRIRFTMNNNKSFVICADDAEADGYTLLWSEDADERITEK